MKKIIVFFTTIILLSFNPVLSAGTEALLFYNKALDYYKMGLYDDAIFNFKKAVDADPEFVDAYFNLGSVYEYLQQYDEALSVFKQVVVRAPEDYDAVYHAAWLSYKLGETDKAMKFLSLIPENTPRSEDARKLYLTMGQKPVFKQENIQTSKPQSRANDIFEGIPSPTGIASDSDGNIYIAQYSSNSIMKITPEGKKILFIKNSKINGPIGIDFDRWGNLYIANYTGGNILKVSAGGTTSVIISNISKPYGLKIFEDTLYVSLQGTNSVLKYKLK